MTPLNSSELSALRSLHAAYPDTPIAIIGAVALRFHMDMTWRSSADIDLVIAVSASQIEAGFDTTEAQAFILGREVAAVVDEHDRKTVNAFLELMAGDVHFSRFANSSPWRYDESELRKRIDPFQRGFTATDPLARE